MTKIKLLLCIIFTAALFLTGISSATIDTVSSISPANNTWSNQGAAANTINFTFNYIGNRTNASCQLFINNIGYGINATVFNNTNTIIKNNASVTEGSRLWNITCTDAESTSVTSGYLTLNVDRTAPTSTISQPANNTWTTDTTPELNFTLADTLDSTINYTVYIDGILNISVGSAANNTPQLLNISTLSEATHSIIIEATDEAQNKVNSSALVITVDNTPPTSVINSPADGNSTNDTTPQINFTLTDALDTVLNYTVFLDGVANLSGTANNATPKLLNFSALSEGSHIIIVQAVDEALNAVNSTAITLTIDTTAPVVEAGSNETENSVFSSTSATDRTAIASVTDATGIASYLWTANSSNVGFSENTSLLTNINSSADGSYLITLNATDVFGESAGDTFVLVWDTAAPTISFSLSDTSVYLNEEITGSCSASDTADSSVSVSISEIITSSTGTKTATCTATDDAGNSASSSLSYIVNIRFSGGGGSSSAPTQNAQSNMLAHIEKGIAYVTFDKTGVNVQEIVLEILESKDDVKITSTGFVSKPANIPDLVDQAKAKKAYKYMEISHSNLENKDIGSAKIKFNVEKSWLESNGYKSSEIVLFRLTTEWDQLKTTLLKEDAANYYFEAESPGLSFFAIGTKEQEALTMQPIQEEEQVQEQIAKTESQPESAPVNINAQSAEKQEATEEKESSKTGWMALILVIFAAIAIAGFYFIKKQEPPKQNEQNAEAANTHSKHAHHHSDSHKK